MMSSQPSTPTLVRKRISEPYRDNPNAPPPLDSYTIGGMGPPLQEGKKSKHLGCWNSCRKYCCREVVDDGFHYEDEFNDLSWSCSIGTLDDNGIWMNRADPAGTLMSAIVWILIGYSAFTMTFLAKTEGIPTFASYCYSLLASLALSCHVKTSLTDPGSVPASAVPTAEQRRANTKLSMCSQCQTFKPPRSHHCKICNRCISGMDHHCPWMNNCTFRSLVSLLAAHPNIVSIRRGIGESEALSAISHLHLVVFRFCTDSAVVQLFLLRQ